MEKSMLVLEVQNNTFIGLDINKSRIDLWILLL